MENLVIVREAVTENDVALFRAVLRAYHERDIFAGPEREERLCGEEQYWEDLRRVHDRPRDRCHYLFFTREGQDIGLALPVIYETEDGKCFLCDFCVFPEHRGGGTGKQCAGALLKWAKENGASYAELNYGGDERRLRFWQSVGFVENGADQWGEPLMILPPAEHIPIAVERLDAPEDWQLLKLENGFLREIGEKAMPEEKQERLRQAVRDGRITFFMAKRGYRAVGMCSVSRCFSTFACADAGVLDDFYVEPAFRGKGIARKLAEAAQGWCRDNGVGSLTVCCAPCDEVMYQSLGFRVRIGSTYAYLS